MAQAFIVGGGGGGTSSDDVTATADKVVVGQTYVGADTNDEPAEGQLNLESTATEADVPTGLTFYNSNDAIQKTGTMELAGSATAENVLAEKTFYSTDPRVAETGTMKDNGVATVQVDRNANIDLEGYYAPGSKAVGQAATDYPAKTWNATMALQTIIPAGGYASGAQQIAAITNSGLTAANVKNGQVVNIGNGASNIISVTGTYKGLGNAAVTDVRTGKTFSTASLSNAIGTVPQQAGVTINPNNQKQTLSYSGKIMTGNIVINAVSNLSAGNIKKGVNVGGVVGTWEGYVPVGVLDIYNRGTLASGWSYGSSGITVYSDHIYGQTISDPIRLIQHTTSFAITNNMSAIHVEYGSGSIKSCDLDFVGGGSGSAYIGSMTLPDGTSSGTLTLDVSGKRKTYTYFQIELSRDAHDLGSGGGINVYHVWIT